jgi:cysteinyl-tRNA synthetase
LIIEANASPISPAQDLNALSIDPGLNGLKATLEKAQAEMNIALSDSFDTPRAMRVLSELIRDTNTHIMDRKTDVDICGLEAVARWITKMVGIFGLDANATKPYNGLGWVSSFANGYMTPEEIVAPHAQVYKCVKAQVSGLSLHSVVLEELVTTDVNSEFRSLVSAGTNDPQVLAMPYLRAISRMRDELRKLAPSSYSKKQILALSDQIRDTDLTNLGVYLDDRGEDQGALIKFVPREELLAQKEEKVAKEREKVAQKEAARLAREKVEAEKSEKAKIKPEDMFRDERYSEWDADGIPTKTMEGEDVPKSQLKKMRKDWEKQKRAHEEWKAKAGQ